jgi:crotonobetainyl-CoA:carnitine CoA-transferase CaiB-like acyl-CoA transferase
MHLIGRPELIEEPWFASGLGRAEHADILDEAVGGWIAERTAADVTAAFAEAQAAVAPVYDIRDIMSDPQYEALASIISVPDADFGQVRMQNVMFRLSDTPGQIRSTGPAKGADNDEIYGSLGFDQDHLNGLRERGVI